jgi:D-lyxose ketol-isomerase
MKRSEINALMADADRFLGEHRFLLPPFAYWKPDEWSAKSAQAREIIECGMGWDITDFGRGDYASCGLFLFTLRNGRPENLKAGRGKVYAEKVLIVGEGQVTPMHFHWIKTEDIINRGGGKLAVKLYNSTEEGGLADTPIHVRLDGVERALPAGETVRLAPGESITLTPGLYHEFWGEEGRVLVGEVSSVNDDHTDNHFHEPVGRFPTIEEDVPPLYLLVGDYEKYVGK